MSHTTTSSPLPTRTSCEQCRTRKLKCNGTPSSLGGCDRCKKDKVQCVYTVRAPIGRPKGALSGSGGVKRRKVGGAAVVDSASPPAQVISSPASSSPSSSSVYGHSRRASGVVVGASSSTTPAQSSPMAGTSTPTPTQSSALSIPYNIPTNDYSLPYTTPLAPSLSSSLATLEMAAFLDSLDRVEIRSSDGLTGDMIPSYSWPGASAGAGAGTSSAFQPFEAQQLPPPPPPAWGGTILDEGVSYAVPSDFSWWDVGLDADFMGGKAPASTSQAAVPLSMDHSSHSCSLDSSTAGTTARTTPSTTSKVDLTPASHSPSLDQKWPRGPENGMGQGQITTQEGQVVTGGPWPVADQQRDGSVSASTSTKVEEASTSPPKSSCCAAKTEKTTPSPSPSPAPTPCPRTGNPSCCCEPEQIAQITAPPANSCCSKKESIDTKPASDTTTTTHDSPASNHSSPRVHCVPNPSGTGCTCLCESDVCLLRVRRTLSTSPERATSSSGEIPSLHLTLSASQAISASCACSSTCPTCRFHPSSSAFNASLLISLSLQIYARAVRILRDGFSDGNGLEIKIGGYTPRKENAKKIALLAMRLELTDLERGMGKVWSVAVGENVPASTETNMEAEAAKRLRDVVGSGEGLGDVLGTPGRPDRRLAPIDRIVIRKLREQLKEMIVRVEALENS